MAAKTSNKKIESLESNKSEIEVVDNLISSSLGEELHDITEQVIDNITEIEKTNVEEDTVFVDPNQVEDQVEEATNIVESLHSSLLVEEVKDIKEVVIQREVSANDVDDFFDIIIYEEKCNNLPLPPSDDFPQFLIWK